MLRLIAVIFCVFSQIASQNAFQIKPRIVDGRIALEQQFPFYVYLNLTLADGSTSSCGGALLNDEFILTAAHCTFKTEWLEAHIGTANLDIPHRVIPVHKSDFIQYPKFLPQIFWNDICRFSEVNFDHF